MNGGVLGGLPGTRQATQRVTLRRLEARSLEVEAGIEDLLEDVELLDPAATQLVRDGLDNLRRLRQQMAEIAARL